MKTYQMPIKQFYSIKEYLDQAVFWRVSLLEKGTIEIRPVFRYARLLIEKMLSKN